MAIAKFTLKIPSIGYEQERTLKVTDTKIGADAVVHFRPMKIMTENLVLIGYEFLI